jgi:aspartate racemase
MHKRIGILGGLSAESTAYYYTYITRTYTERYGDFSQPEIIIYSVSLQKYLDWRNAGEWGEIAADMISAAKGLERAGADFGIIATNTMHIVFEEVQAAVGIPFLHLVDTTVKVIQQRGYSSVALLGTKFTMNEGFWKDRLAAKDITPIVPNLEDQESVNTVIEEELGRGQFKDNSRREFLDIIGKMASAGAEGVVLGCTEIPMLVQQQHCTLPLFDTSAIHAEAALQYAVAKK